LNGLILIAKNIININELLLKFKMKSKFGIPSKPKNKSTDNKAPIIKNEKDRKDFRNFSLTTLSNKVIKNMMKKEANTKLRIWDGFKEEVRKVEIDDSFAVLLFIQKKSGYNTVDVIKNVKKEIDKVKYFLPKNIKISTLMDSSEFIDKAEAKKAKKEEKKKRKQELKENRKEKEADLAETVFENIEADMEVKVYEPMKEGEALEGEEECPNCGKLNPPGSKFCLECGTSFE